jgi:ABC-type cobalamin/Fe3+-siderophores transport system ATPase subunit
MLEAHKLSYQVDGKNLIKDISLQFKPGIIYGILGPNGSGKTTFLKNLAGIWKPNSGKATWNGKNLLDMERREISKIISLVPQYTMVPFEFTVSEMVSMGRYTHGKHDKELFEWAITTVDAWHLKDRRVNQISHGERQRVYIARALVSESPVLLFDEPASSLDIKHQMQIWQLLLKLKEKNRTILVANHDFRAAEQYCDQIALFNQGACLGSDSFQTIMTEHTFDHVFGVTKDAYRQFYSI